MANLHRHTCERLRHAHEQHGKGDATTNNSLPRKHSASTATDPASRYRQRLKLTTEELSRCPGCAELHVDHLPTISAFHISTRDGINDENTGDDTESTPDSDEVHFHRELVYARDGPLLSHYSEEQLNAAGVESWKRLLMALEHDHGHGLLHKCPCLPDMVALLLTQQDEEAHVFMLVDSIVQQSRKPVSRNSSPPLVPAQPPSSHSLVHKHAILPMSKTACEELCTTFNQLLVNVMPGKSNASIAVRRLLQDLWFHWVERMFVTVLGCSAAAHIAHHFGSSSGISILLDVGLAIISDAQDVIRQHVFPIAIDTNNSVALSKEKAREITTHVKQFLSQGTGDRLVTRLCAQEHDKNHGSQRRRSGSDEMIQSFSALKHSIAHKWNSFLSKTHTAIDVEKEPTTSLRNLEQRRRMLGGHPMKKHEATKAVTRVVSRGTVLEPPPAIRRQLSLHYTEILDSQLLSSVDDATTMVSWLPNALKTSAHKWQLAYSSVGHGHGLLNLYRECNKSSWANARASILLVRAVDSAAVFGVLFNDVIGGPANSTRLGPNDAECAFRLRPPEARKLFRPSEAARGQAYAIMSSQVLCFGVPSAASVPTAGVETAGAGAGAGAHVDVDIAAVDVGAGAAGADDAVSSSGDVVPSPEVSGIGASNIGDGATTDVGDAVSHGEHCDEKVVNQSYMLVLHEDLLSGESAASSVFTNQTPLHHCENVIGTGGNYATDFEVDVVEVVVLI